MLVRDILDKEFGFKPPIGEPFKELHAYKRELVFLIEDKGKEYKKVVEEFYSATYNSSMYLKEAMLVVELKAPRVAPGLKLGDIEGLFKQVLDLRYDIQNLIDIYYAGLE